MNNALGAIDKGVSFVECLEFVCLFGFDADADEFLDDFVVAFFKSAFWDVSVFEHFVERVWHRLYNKIEFVVFVWAFSFDFSAWFCDGFSVNEKASKSKQANPLSFTEKPSQNQAE